MKLDLDAIEARAKAATPGPWNRIKSLGSRFWTLGTIRNHTAYPLPETNEDADWSFVEHARADVPALLARTRELEAMAELDEALGNAAEGIMGLDEKRIAELERERDAAKHDYRVAHEALANLVKQAAERETKLEAERDEWERKRNVSDAYAIRLQDALAAIADHPHNAYPNPRTAYETGVADGHRCAAQIAALNLGRNCPGCSYRHQPGVSCTEHAQARATSEASR